MHVSLAKKTSESVHSCEFNHPLLSQTFTQSSKKLPTISEIKRSIYTDRKWADAGEFEQEKHQRTMQIRESYVGQSFVLLTDEFIKSLQSICANITGIVELGAGVGWLGDWLCKYGVNLQASIDNKSWSDFPQDRYLDIVEQMDSLEYLRCYPDVELFILAWPEEDDLASQIWQALRPGQHLLYIGENRGGCTANNIFFDFVHGCEVENSATKKMKESFLSFDDFYDQPSLYQKR